jgi:hypothetical protein
MKTFIIFLLFCASVFGAEGDLRVISTSKTNAEAATITTKNVFTRDGQTNLVRDTKTKSGAIQIRLHRFYHAGLLVGEFMATPNSSGFMSEADMPYSVSMEFDASRNPKSVVVGAKDGVILDAFNYTNGMFSPVESSFIKKANSVRTEVQGVMEDLKK